MVKPIVCIDTINNMFATFARYGALSTFSCLMWSYSSLISDIHSRARTRAGLCYSYIVRAYSPTCYLYSAAILGYN
jgi:hypothetical protein